MSHEQLQPQRVFAPSAWLDSSDPITQKYDNDGFLPKLDSEEINRLAQASANPTLDELAQLVPNRVPMHQFKNVFDFALRQNNFSIYFDSQPGSFAWQTMRRQKHFQRFEFLFPDRVALLTEQWQQSDRSDDHWENLYDAYQKMAKLVSGSDLDNGTIDEWFLTK